MVVVLVAAVVVVCPRMGHRGCLCNGMAVTQPRVCLRPVITRAPNMALVRMNEQDERRGEEKMKIMKRISGKIYNFHFKPSYFHTPPSEDCAFFNLRDPCFFEPFFLRKLATTEKLLVKF